MLTTTLLCLVASASPIKVATARFNAVDVSEGRADFYTEHFADRLADEGVDVVTPREVQTLLGLERQKALLGCDEMTSSCLAEIGSALGVDGIVLGDVAKVGDGYQMNVKIISAVNGRRLSAKSARIASEGALLEALTVAAKQIAVDLSRELDKPLGARRADADIGVTEVPAAREPSAARTFWWLPAAAGVAIGAAGGVGLGIAESNRARLASENLSAPQASELLSNGQTARTLGWVGVGVGAAALGTGLLMLILGGDTPAAPVATVSADGAVVGFAGRFP
ncbi:MAG: hypothetical protein ACO1OB_20085 [Archangium sp.]